MMDLNIFENKLWGSSGYYNVTIVTWSNIYIDNGNFFFVWKPLTLLKKILKPIENHKAAKKEPQKTYFLECS